MPSPAQLPNNLVAAEVENLLWGRYGRAKASDYRHHARMLRTNLSLAGNAELRSRVLSGELRPEEICSAGSDKREVPCFFISRLHVVRQSDYRYKGRNWCVWPAVNVCYSESFPKWCSSQIYFLQKIWNFIPEIETDFPSNWEIHQFFGSRSWFPWTPNLWHQKICGSNAKNNKKRWGIWMSGGDVNMGCVANPGQKDFRWKTESMSKAFWRYPNVGHCSYILLWLFMYYIMHQLAPQMPLLLVQRCEITLWLLFFWKYASPKCFLKGVERLVYVIRGGLGWHKIFSPLFWSKSSPFDGTIPAVYCYSCVLCTDNFRPQIHPNNLKKSWPRW